MGSRESNSIDLGQGLYCRDLSRLKKGTKLILTYFPDTGGSTVERCIGQVTGVKRLGGGRVVFRFADPDEKEVLQVRIGETIGESQVFRVSSGKKHPLGHLLRLRVFPDASRKTELLFRTIVECESGRHEAVAVAADTHLNQHILRWFSWSEDTA